MRSLHSHSLKENKHLSCLSSLAVDELDEYREHHDPHDCGHHHDFPFLERFQNELERICIYHGSLMKVSWKPYDSILGNRQ